MKKKIYKMKAFVIFVVLLHLCFRSCHGNEKFASSTVVTFDPYVSILDKYNRFRYDVGDMLPMVSPVATNFSKLFIELTEEDYTHDVLHSSRIQSVVTVAIYNTQNQFSPLEVWLSFRELSNSLTGGHFSALRDSLQSIAVQASRLYQPTVTTIFFPFHFFNRFANIPTGKRNSNRRLTLFDQPWLSWGWVTPASECASNLVLFRSLRPHRVLLRYPAEKLVDMGPAEVVVALKSTMDECFKRLNTRNSKSFNMGIMVSIPDTDATGKVNMSRLVETWGEVRRWSETNGTTVVLSKAFDTPYENSVELKTSGWWRLQENPSYKNVADYKFERKKDIAKSFDLEENTIHLIEQDNSSAFMERNYTGVILNLYDALGGEEGSSIISELKFEPLLKNVSDKFSKLMLVFDDDTQSRKVDTTNYELNALAKIKDGFDEIILMVLPNVDVLPYFSRNELLGQVRDLISTYIVPCTGNGNETDEIVAYLKTNVLSNKPTDSYEIGYGLDISLCSSFPVIKDMEKDTINETLQMPNVQKILFYFEEDESTVRLGANRMFQQRIIMFEQCKRFLANYKKNWIYGFVLLHYEISRNYDFYEDARALADLVNYSEMLNAWALNTKTMVIVGDVLDGTRVLKAKRRQVNQVGWWRQHDMSVSGGIKWIDKRADALQKIQTYQETNFGATRTFPTTTTTKPSSPPSIFISSSSTTPAVPNLTTNKFKIMTAPLTTTTIRTTTLAQFSIEKSFTSPATLPSTPNQPDSSMNPGLIALITIVPIILCTIIGISTVFLVRRYFKDTVLTKDEFYEFLHGGTSPTHNPKDDYDLGNTDQVDGNEIAEIAYKFPYDKSKYEIYSQQFSVNETGVLGAGEFGKVCRGIIHTENQGAIEVAVKVANAAKQHKTVLKGLLSEIKILSYIGKHDNITEMIGANTSDLKQGKVYIFLELCQLGSLEKYIRKLRPKLDEDEGVNKGMEKADKSRYYNMKNMKSSQLDSSLYQDMYRWSTEICSGMAYLATKHVVHADLAARNVLLNAKKEAKICDFGLSRRMYNYTNYVKTQQEPLPWKWMAPESLRLFEFNEKTDVWAFGITLWEIYSLGDNPYPGLSYDVNFPALLEQGLRLTKPKYDDPDDHMYSEVMQDCWKLNPAARPSFADLLARLTNSLT